MTMTAELVEMAGLDAVSIDRQTFNDLLAEPTVAHLRISLADEQNVTREEMGVLRDVHLMAPKQALDRVMQQTRSSLANYQGTAIVKLAALDEDGTTLRTMTFTAQGRAAPSFESGLRGEPMSQGDVVATLVQQNQYLLKTVMLSQAHVLQENQDLRRRERERERERFEFVREREEFLSRKHERELTAKMTEAEIANRREMKERIITLAQIAVNKMHGKELVRMKQTPFEVASYNALLALNPSLDALVESGTMSQAQRMAIATWLEAAHNSLMTSEEKAELDRRAKAQQNGLVTDDPLYAQTSQPAPTNGHAGANGSNGKSTLAVVADLIGGLGIQVGKGGSS